MGTVTLSTHLGPLTARRATTTTGRTVLQMRGIPFGRAARFAHPEPVDGWHGTLDATEHGPQSPQIPSSLEQALGTATLPMDEACLRLTVTTPSCEGSRPVLVWVHGGAFLTGTAAAPWYDGSALAARGDVVVVSVGYRLGAFGFLGDVDAGLADQVEALRWVNRHIAAFGGDPSCVTVLGESAGGSSVLALLAAPSTAGLIHRAWAMSPSIGQLRTVTRAAEVEREILRLTGCSDRAELRHRPVEDVLTAQQTIVATRSGAGFDAFAPTAGGAVVPGPVTAAAAESPVPLVLGTTRDESNLFVMMDPAQRELDEHGLHSEVSRRLAERTDDALAVYRRLRPGATPAQLLAAVLTDQTFRVPAQRLAAQRAAHARPTWMTWFTWASPVMGGLLGACHGLDIPFAFDNLHQPGVDMFTGDGDDRRQVADAHADAVIGFARTGVAGWSPHTSAGGPVLRIDRDTVEIPDPEPELRLLWGDGPAGA